ncbi:hypothetical protein HDU96_000595 [Phlyctochytrium bullatum]|nr:hypothetical protein HDU96_000595 [Phlyctochytrium bullatum]
MLVGGGAHVMAPPPAPVHPLAAAPQGYLPVLPAAPVSPATSSPPSTPAVAATSKPAPPRKRRRDQDAATIIPSRLPAAAAATLTVTPPTSVATTPHVAPVHLFPPLTTAHIAPAEPGPAGTAAAAAMLLAVASHRSPPPLPAAPGPATAPGARDFVCPHAGCGMTFSRRHNLLCHLTLHTGERPYVCEERVPDPFHPASVAVREALEAARGGFARADGLASHLRRKHGIVPKTG